MGYYTNFCITTKPMMDEDTEKKAVRNLRAISGYYEGASSFYDFCHEPMKWYDCESDMRKLSVLYPDTLFIVKGEGEDTGDLWKEYFKNGKYQMCIAKIIFEEPNYEYLGVEE